MDEAITYRTATVEDALSMCEFGQLLNAVHHAARPDIYAARAKNDAQDLRLSVWPFNAHAARMYTEFGVETRAFEMGMRL